MCTLPFPSRAGLRGDRRVLEPSSTGGGARFGDVPLSLEYKLEVWDSPNSAA